MLYTASVTDALVTLATHIIRDLGLGGVLLLNTITNVIFVPGTEPTMLFAGFNVYQHHLTMVGIIVFGVLGDLLGATIAYLIGYFGLYEVLERLPGPLNLGPHGLDRAEAWFDRWGLPAMTVSRWIPGGRAAGPYAAGIVKMPYLRFLPATAVGSIVWITGLAFIGKGVGASWNSWRKHLDYVDYAVVVIVIALLGWWIYKRVRASREHHEGLA